MGIESAQDLWNLLERHFSDVSQDNIHQLHYHLQSISKGGLSMDSYLQSVKEITDGLATVGQSLSKSDLVVCAQWSPLMNMTLSLLQLR